MQLLVTGATDKMFPVTLPKMKMTVQSSLSLDNFSEKETKV